MNLNQYLAAKRGEAVRLANSIGCTPVFIRSVANGHRNCSASNALAIERETNGAVTIAELRPAFAESLRQAGYVKTAPPTDSGEAD